ncbi:MAG: O-antigen ligase family protein [Deltaproteobacteria bacterium]|nr:O-antigen ligase family protein [Deltaproteobacteria bacterium]MBW2012350.1 O-antigen ligase family protein [Deltaproteobacteria bacterium]
MTFSRSIIFFIIATIPVFFAAVQAWIWSFYTAGIFAAFLILLWQNRINKAWLPDKIYIFAMGAFYLVCLLQCLPLPSTILSFLSPFRHKVLTQSMAIIHGSVGWQSISYASLRSLAWWTFLLGLLLLFFIFRITFTSSRHLKILIYILLVLAAAEAIYGLIQALVPSLGVLWIDYIEAYLGDARGTYINRNHFAGFIEMILPLSLGYTLALGNWKEKLSLKALMSTDRPNFQFFLTIGLAVMVLALLFSKSRAGITGWGLGFLTFVILVHSGSNGIPRSFWVITSIIIGMVAFFSFRIGVDPILERFLKISKEASRLNFWRDSLVIVKDHPFGIGLATFKQVFPVYNVSTISEKTLYYAHNDYLQLLVEAGWIGFLALVSGFYIFLVRSFRKVRRMRLQADPFRFFLTIGALSGLVSIAFHSFFDFNLHMPANCVYFVILIGIVDVCLWQGVEGVRQTNGG